MKIFHQACLWSLLKLLKSLFSLDKNTKWKVAQKHWHAKRPAEGSSEKNSVLLMTDVSTNLAEVILIVKWMVLVSQWYYKSAWSIESDWTVKPCWYWLKVCLYQSLVSSNPFIGNQIGLSIVSQIQRFLWSADRMVADGRWQNADGKMWSGNWWERKCGCQNGDDKMWVENCEWQCADDIILMRRIN